MISAPVLGIGGALVDAVLPVSDDFLKKHVPGGKGGMVMVRRGEQDCWIAASGKTPVRATGGAAGNTVFALGHLGFPAAMLGKIGRDSDGTFYRKKLLELGVEPLLFESAASGTGRCLAMVTPDSERTMRTALGASAELTPEEIGTVDFSRFGVVYIEGYQLFNKGVVPQVQRLARKNGCLLAMDSASFEVMKLFRDEVLAMLGNGIDMIFANEEEAAVLTGPGLSAEAMALELGKSCSVAAVKRGARGSCICRNGKLTVVEIEPVHAVDTTAAGDTWAAGYLYGYCRGLSDAASGRIGSALSAEIVQVFGAELPENIWEKLRKQIQEC